MENFPNNKKRIFGGDSDPNIYSRPHKDQRPPDRRGTQGEGLLIEQDILIEVGDPLIEEDTLVEEP